MIEDYQARRRRARIVARSLFGAGIVLALLAAIAAYAYVTQTRPVAPGQARVVVAAHDIAARTVIGTDDVRLAEVDPAVVPAGALGDLSAAVGRAAAVPIAAREVLTPLRFASTAAGIGVFPAGEQPTGNAPDYRAMSLNVLDANAAGGNVQAGDTIDLVFAFALEPDVAARIVAERVPVLARAATIYTLRIDAAQAERIAALQAGGATVQLLLRAGNDTRSPRASGALFANEAGAIIRPLAGTPRPSASPVR